MQSPSSTVQAASGDVAAAAGLLGAVLAWTASAYLPRLSWPNVAPGSPSQSTDRPGCWPSRKIGAKGPSVVTVQVAVVVSGAGGLRYPGVVGGEAGEGVEDVAALLSSCGQVGA